jgi:tetratricopeptide (TPR) repeat protein
VRTETEEIRRLDELKFTTPEAVVSACEKIYSGVAVVNKSEVLGVCGSAYRNLLNLRAACQCLIYALQWSKRLCDTSARARLLQRFSYVQADLGKLARALFLVEQALILHFRAGDIPSAAKAMVDQGTWLFYLDRYEEARAVLACALKLLPESAVRNRTAALAAMSYCHLRLGQAAKAKDLLPELSPGCMGMARVAWLAGEIALEQRYFNEATKQLKVACDGLAHPGDKLLATTDLVRALLKKGDGAAAGLLARSAQAIASPLKANPAVWAAANELQLAGWRSDGLTTAKLVTIRRICFKALRPAEGRKASASAVGFK